MVRIPACLAQVLDTGTYKTIMRTECLEVVVGHHTDLPDLGTIPSYKAISGPFL